METERDDGWGWGWGLYCLSRVLLIDTTHGLIREFLPGFSLHVFFLFIVVDILGLIPINLSAKVS